MKISAVIFDMDGLMIDSEPLWQLAEIRAFREVGLELTREMCAQHTGIRVDEVVDIWYGHHPWDLARFPKPQVVQQIINELIRQINDVGQPMAGLEAALDFFQRRNLPLALASSSNRAIIEAVLARLKLGPRFSVIHSAEHEPYGKPHPGVYLSTAEQLGVSPRHCLALEDSINGVIAAKAARMACIAVPDPAHIDDRRFGIADVVLPSLTELDETIWKRLTGQA